MTYYKWKLSGIRIVNHHFLTSHLLLLKKDALSLVPCFCAHTANRGVVPHQTKPISAAPKPGLLAAAFTIRENSVP